MEAKRLAEKPKRKREEGKKDEGDEKSEGDDQVVVRRSKRVKKEASSPQ